ncbi:conserved Plasmodium protein, unknown function [Plasmodium sp. gorilla clade G3]|nr:conserved Plasmodium protein, unknown function [Plasmodium sp. gorilla clade G3]
MNNLERIKQRLEESVEKHKKRLLITREKKKQNNSAIYVNNKNVNKGKSKIILNDDKSICTDNKKLTDTNPCMNKNELIENLRNTKLLLIKKRRSLSNMKKENNIINKYDITTQLKNKSCLIKEKKCFLKNKNIQLKKNTTSLINNKKKGMMKYVNKQVYRTNLSYSIENKIKSRNNISHIKEKEKKLKDEEDKGNNTSNNDNNTLIDVKISDNNNNNNNKNNNNINSFQNVSKDVRDNINDLFRNFINCKINNLYVITTDTNKLPNNKIFLSEGQQQFLEIKNKHDSKECEIKDEHLDDDNHSNYNNVQDNPYVMKKQRQEDDVKETMNKNNMDDIIYVHKHERMSSNMIIKRNNKNDNNNNNNNQSSIHHNSIYETYEKNLKKLLEIEYKMKKKIESFEKYKDNNNYNNILSTKSSASSYPYGHDDDDDNITLYSHICSNKQHVKNEIQFDQSDIDIPMHVKNYIIKRMTSSPDLKSNITNEESLYKDDINNNKNNVEHHNNDSNNKNNVEYHNNDSNNKNNVEYHNNDSNNNITYRHNSYISTHDEDCELYSIQKNIYFKDIYNIRHINISNNNTCSDNDKCIEKKKKNTYHDKYNCLSSSYMENKILQKLKNDNDYKYINYQDNIIHNELIEKCDKKKKHIDLNNYSYEQNENKELDTMKSNQENYSSNYYYNYCNEKKNKQKEKIKKRKKKKKKKKIKIKNKIKNKNKNIHMDNINENKNDEVRSNISFSNSKDDNSIYYSSYVEDKYLSSYNKGDENINDYDSYEHNIYESKKSENNICYDHHIKIYNKETNEKSSCLKGLNQLVFLSNKIYSSNINKENIKSFITNEAYEDESIKEKNLLIKEIEKSEEEKMPYYLKEKNLNNNKNKYKNKYRNNNNHEKFLQHSNDIIIEEGKKKKKLQSNEYIIIQHAKSNNNTILLKKDKNIKEDYNINSYKYNEQNDDIYEQIKSSSIKQRKMTCILNNKIKDSHMLYKDNNIDRIEHCYICSYPIQKNEQKFISNKGEEKKRKGNMDTSYKNSDNYNIVHPSYSSEYHMTNHLICSSHSNINDEKKKSYLSTFTNKKKDLENYMSSHTMCSKKNIQDVGEYHKNGNNENDDVYNDDVYNDDIHNDDIHNDDIHNDDIHNDDIHNDDIHNDDIHNDDIHNDDIHNDDIHNDDIHNDDIHNNNIHNNNIHNNNIHNNNIHKNNIHKNNIHNNNIYNHRYGLVTYNPKYERGKAIQYLPQKHKVIYKNIYSNQINIHNNECNHSEDEKYIYIKKENIPFKKEREKKDIFSYIKGMYLSPKKKKKKKFSILENEEYTNEESSFDIHSNNMNNHLIKNKNILNKNNKTNDLENVKCYENIKKQNNNKSQSSYFCSPSPSSSNSILKNNAESYFLKNDKQNNQKVKEDGQTINNQTTTNNAEKKRNKTYVKTNSILLKKILKMKIESMKREKEDNKEKNNHNYNNNEKKNHNNNEKKHHIYDDDNNNNIQVIDYHNDKIIHNKNINKIEIIYTKDETLITPINDNKQIREKGYKNDICPNDNICNIKKEYKNDICPNDNICNIKKEYKNDICPNDNICNIKKEYKNDICPNDNICNIKKEYKNNICPNDNICNIKKEYKNDICPNDNICNIKKEYKNNICPNDNICNIKKEYSSIYRHSHMNKEILKYNNISIYENKESHDSISPNDYYIHKHEQKTTNRNKENNINNYNNICNSNNIHLKDNISPSYHMNNNIKDVVKFNESYYCYFKNVQKNDVYPNSEEPITKEDKTKLLIAYLKDKKKNKKQENNNTSDKYLLKYNIEYFKLAQFFCQDYHLFNNYIKHVDKKLSKENNNDIDCLDKTAFSIIKLFTPKKNDLSTKYENKNISQKNTIFNNTEKITNQKININHLHVVNDNENKIVNNFNKSETEIINDKRKEILYSKVQNQKKSTLLSDKNVTYNYPCEHLDNYKKEIHISTKDKYAHNKNKTAHGYKIINNVKPSLFYQDESTKINQNNRITPTERKGKKKQIVLKTIDLLEKYEKLTAK